MDLPKNLTYDINGQIFEIIRPTRLNEGMVLKSGDIFARMGPKKIILKEQNHTTSLYNHGFPVAKILDYGETSDGQWYFTETSLGKATFHEIFEKEYKNNGEISRQTFNQYLATIKKYVTAQFAINNRTTISATKFIKTLLPEQRVLNNYCYFGYDANDYIKAIKLATTKLTHCQMGILQFDLNPFNVLKNGVIDFELVGSGPIAYDVLMSTRWGSSWFTDYPSLHSIAYKLTNNQIEENDKLISNLAAENDLTDPTQYLQEFLLLKSAWAASDFNPPQNDWPKNKIAFRRYRANVLKAVIEMYLSKNIINYQLLSSIPGGELE